MLGDDQIKNASVDGVVVLAVSGLIEDQASLRTIFRHSNWTLCCAETLDEARAVLSRVPVGVVVCEEAQPWKDLLQQLWTVENPPPLVVSSRLDDDDIWAEVLNLGGYDVLTKPFDQREVFHILAMAWLAWREGRFHPQCR